MSFFWIASDQRSGHLHTKALQCEYNTLRKYSFTFSWSESKVWIWWLWESVWKIFLFPSHWFKPIVALCCCQTSHSCLFDYISAVVSRIYHSVVVKFTEQGNEVIAVSAIILEKSLHVTKNNERHQPKQNDEEDLPIRVLTLSLCLITCVYMCVCVRERACFDMFLFYVCILQYENAFGLVFKHNPSQLLFAIGAIFKPEPWVWNERVCASHNEITFLSLKYTDSRHYQN